MCPFQMSSDGDGGGAQRQESIMGNLVSNPQDPQFLPALISCPLSFPCSDKMFPAFGFGARIPPDFKVTSLSFIVEFTMDFMY